MAYVITQGCIDILDRSCVDVCPVDCLYEGNRMMYINPDECIDCAACEAVCPQEAIFYSDFIPEEMREFQGESAEFIASRGLQGGGSIVGKVTFDSDLVEGIPRRDT